MFKSSQDSASDSHSHSISPQLVITITCKRRKAARSGRFPVCFSRDMREGRWTGIQGAFQITTTHLWNASWISTHDPLLISLSTQRVIQSTVAFLLLHKANVLYSYLFSPFLSPVVHGMVTRPFPLHSTGHGQQSYADSS